MGDRGQGLELARATLVRLPFGTKCLRRCSQTLMRGEVKRVPQTGALVGYFVCCPACGFTSSFLDEELHAEEVPDKRETSRTRALLATWPVSCLSCKRQIQITTNWIEARPCST